MCMSWLSGVYAVVLVAEDKAGNAEVARRFLIFDNTNVVTIIEDKQLVVLSAAENTTHMWVTSLQGRDNAGEQAS